MSDEDETGSFVDYSHAIIHVRQFVANLDLQPRIREELEGLYEQSNQIRYRAARDFAILREQVIENTSESEWKQINKELKAFFK